MTTPFSPRSAGNIEDAAADQDLWDGDKKLEANGEDVEWPRWQEANFPEPVMAGGGDVTVANPPEAPLIPPLTPAAASSNSSSETSPTRGSSESSSEYSSQEQGSIHGSSSSPGCSCCKKTAGPQNLPRWFCRFRSSLRLVVCNKKVVCAGLFTAKTTLQLKYVYFKPANHAPWADLMVTVSVPAARLSTPDCPEAAPVDRVRSRDSTKTFCHGSNVSYQTGSGAFPPEPLQSLPWSRFVALQSPHSKHPCNTLSPPLPTHPTPVMPYRTAELSHSP
jgi:hypothetical protein